MDEKEREKYAGINLSQMDEIERLKAEIETGKSLRDKNWRYFYEQYSDMVAEDAGVYAALGLGYSQLRDANKKMETADRILSALLPISDSTGGKSPYQVSVEIQKTLAILGAQELRKEILNEKDD